MTRSPRLSVLLILSTFGLAAASCFAQAGRSRQTAQNQNPADGATSEVSGEVIDAVSQQPIRKITLQLFAHGPGAGILRVLNGPGGGIIGNSDSYAAQSDDSGHFDFPAVPPGSYILQGYGNDYPVQVYGQTGSLLSVERIKVVPGQNLDNLRFKLEPGVVITGRVVDQDGDPVANAAVTAIAKRFSGGSLLYTRSGGARTDDLGNYRIFALPAGHYYVTAEKASRRFGGTATGETIYASEFYPGTTDLATATVLDAKPGDVEGGIDVTLLPVQAARISGSVTGAMSAGVGPGGRRMPGFFVMLQPSDPAMRFIVPLQQMQRRIGQGGFEFDNVAPGSYILTAISTTRGQRLMAQLPVTVAAGEDLTGLALTLSPGTEITGTVAADPSPGFDVKSLVIRLDSETNQFGQGFARVNADGTFTIENVFPGKYRVELPRIPPPYYLKSATLNGTDVLDRGATVLAGSPAGTLAIALGIDGATLTGTVNGTDGQPLNDAAVVLIPDPPHRDRGDLYKIAHTNAMGAFTIQGIAPGDYKAFSWENIEAGEYRDPDFIKQYEDHGQDVALTANGNQSVKLQVIPQAAEP